MLKVDDAYLSRSQAFIRWLFSGVEGNSSSVGQWWGCPLGTGAHGASAGLWAFEAVVNEPTDVGRRGLCVPSGEGKALGSGPRLSNDS